VDRGDHRLFLTSYTTDGIRHALPMIPFTFAKDALFPESDSKSSEFTFASIYIRSKELIFAKQFGDYLTARY
jgi:hypothetical protein